MSKWIKACTCFLCAALANSADAAWVTLCKGQTSASISQPSPGYRTYALAADGSMLVLEVTEELPVTECLHKELPVSSGSILWGGFLPGLSNATRQIALQGTVKAGRFSVSEVIPQETTKPAPQNETHLASRSAVEWHVAQQLRASWFWSPSIWMETPHRIFELASSLKIVRAYITVPVRDGTVTHREELKNFIRMAHGLGLQVWAVAGDPRSVLEQERPAILAMASAYRAFNAEMPQETRLDGLQFDIEPYVLPGYKFDIAGWQAKYADTINAAHETAPELPLDIVLPFWINPETGPEAAMLRSVLPGIESITVMDYRTDPDQIRRLAEPFLAWGEKWRKPVHIALESLHISDEERRHFVRGESGELWLLDMGDFTFLLLSEQKQSFPDMTAFRFAYSTRWEAGGTTFYGNRDRLLELLPALEAGFKSWPSFAGIALHGIE